MKWKEVFSNFGFIILFFVVVSSTALINNSKVDIDFSDKRIFLAAVLFASLWVSSGLFYILFFAINKKIGPKIIETESLYLELKDETKKIQNYDQKFIAFPFLKDCESLAKKLNDAWCNNKMDTVRNLVSAGLYNRFKIQLKIMDSQDVRNVMDHWMLNKLILKSADSNGEFQEIHVEISARAKDKNLPKALTDDEIKSELESVKQSSYTEIWSFIRKRGIQSDFTKSLLSGHCPNCGTGIDDLGELNKCKSCGSIINSGEYDWVLSEITQYEEWTNNSAKGTVDLSSFINESPLANKQMIEDRASYLFWRWIDAGAQNRKDPLLRDSTKNFLDSFNSFNNYFYDTAVGAVDLKGFKKLDDGYEASVLILWSAAGSSTSQPIHKENKFYLKITGTTKKSGGLSENSCETCGAPLPESDSLKCDYCNSDTPPLVSDWLLDKIESA